nr:nmrA-like family domain-containing protein 1 [Loxodonta africana]
MAGKKVIAVYGATGAQGGSVAKAILESKNFAVRAVTRDVTQPKALVLQDLGAKVVKGDLNDEASVEAALKDAYGTFVVTNFWEHFSKEKEVLRGRLVADVAKHLGLQHMVFSGLENIKRLSGGKLEVPHFDGKGEVGEFFWSVSIPMTSVCVAAYYENFLLLWKPVKAADRDYYTLGKWKVITPEAYEKLGLPGAEDIANMCRFYCTKPDRDVKLTHRLNPKVKSFSQFISENQGAFKGSQRLVCPLLAVSSLPSLLSPPPDGSTSPA